mgnify:FL=1
MINTIAKIAAAIAGIASVLVPLIKWWLRSQNKKIKQQEAAVKELESMIKEGSSVSVADMQSRIDDLLNGL